MEAFLFDSKNRDIVSAEKKGDENVKTRLDDQIESHHHYNSLMKWKSLLNGRGIPFPEWFHSLRIEEAINDAPASVEKPLATNERNTLLTIAALCDFSAIKYQSGARRARLAQMTERWVAW